MSCIQISPVHCYSVQKKEEEMQCIKQSFWEIQAEQNTLKKQSTL